MGIALAHNDILNFENFAVFGIQITTTSLFGVFFGGLIGSFGTYSALTYLKNPS